MQQHGQAVLPGQPELGAVEKLLALAHGRGAERGHKKIQPDFAHRHQPGIPGAAGEFGIQPIQIGFIGLRHIQRVDAQRIGIAVGMGQGLHGMPVVGLHGRQHAQRHALLADVPVQRGQAGQLGRIQMGVGVDPDRRKPGCRIRGAVCHVQSVTCGW